MLFTRIISIARALRRYKNLFLRTVTTRMYIVKHNIQKRSKNCNAFFSVRLNEIFAIRIGVYGKTSAYALR